MLQDHSSRWSAAASPGGLIGLVLTIFALMALATSVLSLTGQFELGLSDTVLFVVLGVAVFATFLLVYLLIAYVTISYRLDDSQLNIRAGLWSARIPYDEMESVEPATDILGEQGAGWQPYWPGYYVGSKNTDAGKVRVIATLPPRRQIGIIRSDGEIFLISPERPQLFIEDLARWHEAYFAAIEMSEQTTAQHPAAIQEVPDWPESDAALDGELATEFVHVDEPVAPSYQTPEELRPDEPQPVWGYQQASHAEPEVASPERAEFESRPQPEPMELLEEQSASQAFGFRGVPTTPETPPQVPREYQPPPAPESQPSPPSSDLPDELERAEPVSGPVFGTTSPADAGPQPAPRFGVAPPEVEPSYVPADALPEQQPPDDSETPTNQLEVWFPDPPADQPDDVDPYQQFSDAGWTTEQPSIGHVPQTPGGTPFAPPEPVIAPAGTPRSEVMQPLTRVYRAELPGTSPAIRPVIHRDSVSLGMVAASLVTGLSMAIYILTQYNDIPPSLTLHWNAEGLPGRIGEPREIWIIPLIAGIVMLANVGLAWSIAQFDRFAARLALSSTLITHVMLWIALLMIL